MEDLFGIFALLAVLLRAATLVLQSFTIGGIVFILAVTRTSDLCTMPVLHRCRRGIRWSAVALASVQIVFALANTCILMASADMTLADVAGASFMVASAMVVAAAFCIACV